MKTTLLISFLFQACFVFSQTIRLTNEEGRSFTSENNAQCIAAEGNNVHVVWTDDRTGNNEIFYKRSTENGSTWEEDDQLTFSLSNASYPSIVMNGSDIHVVWMDGRDGNFEIYYKKSSDSGQTWGPDLRLTNNIGDSAHPSLAIAGQVLHLVWHDNRLGSNEIYYKNSIDNGISWKPDLRLTNDADAYVFPSIAVHLSSVHVVWQNEAETKIVYSRSLDGGNGWMAMTELTTIDSPTEQPTITVSENFIYVFWSDWRDDDADLWMRRSVNNGSTWEAEIHMSSSFRDAVSPRAVASGNFVLLVWNDMLDDIPEIFYSTSTDGGVSWSIYTVLAISEGHSSRPFVRLLDRDLHIVSTEQTDTTEEIYYQRIIRVNPYNDKNIYEWGHGFIGSGKDVGNDVLADSAGNVYVTGSFSVKLDMDASAGTTNLTSAGGSDVFIAKYNPEGQLIWAKRAGGTGEDVSYALALDAEGNLYATGTFSATVDFDPGSSVHSLTSGGQSDVFVLKLDPAGNFVWAKRIGGSGHDVARSMVVGQEGYIYLTGSFSGTADFDPSDEEVHLLSQGQSDIFISKLDLDGQFVWAKSVGGPNADAAHGITLDKHGSIGVTGSFSGTVDFDPDGEMHLLISKGLKDIFVLKLDDLGRRKWSVSFGETEDDEGNSIIYDQDGNLYSTGYFQKKVDFNPDTSFVYLQSSNLKDVFVLKLDSTGQYVWAGKFGRFADEGKDITLDNLGNIYTTGFFSGYSDFDPGPENALLRSNYLEDVFISKLSRDGEYIWANHLNGSTVAGGNAIFTRSSAYVYCTGYYLDDLDLDPTIGIDQHVTIDAAEDFFVLQIKQCEPSVSNLVESACDFYIAPDQETLLTNSGVYEFIIPSASGCDSVITLHLTITESSASNFSVTACDQYTSPEGSTWTTTGVYQEILLNAAGCDSIITYHLTIEESSVHVVEASGCNSYTTPDGLFTWTVSGIYQVVVINQTECDSIISYNITIHTDQQSTVELTACDSYTTPDGMNSWSVSGVYTYTLFSSTGCDSTITLHLTIEASDVSVIQTDSTLQAVQNNAGYQWIDCANGDAAIPGETSQTFSPSVNGNYAVVVNHNGCIDTSACYAMMILGTDIDPDRPRIRIFPNPAEDHFYIHFGRPYRDVTIEIKNMDGKILSAFSVDDLQMFHIEHALPSGMYFISIKLDGYHFVEKLSIP